MSNEEKKIPTEVIASKATEFGVSSLTLAGKFGYSYLRHCVATLRKKAPETFKQYSLIKDNRTSLQQSRNKTPASRRAAYKFAAEKVVALASGNLKEHARKFLESVCTDSHEKVSSLIATGNHDSADLAALQLAGEIASEGYNREFQGGSAHQSPASDGKGDAPLCFTPNHKVLHNGEFVEISTVLETQVVCLNSECTNHDAHNAQDAELQECKFCPECGAGVDKTNTVSIH